MGNSGPVDVLCIYRVKAGKEGECPRCGYVGWARPRDLNESVRRALRDRPLERRRLRPAS